MPFLYMASASIRIYGFTILLPLLLYTNICNTCWFCCTLQPELVQRVEKDLLNIMAGGTADILFIYTSFVNFTPIDTSL